MTDARLHAGERDELSRIDYFLEHIARAVERGEVPMASYDVLAPRYLTRRAELVAILMAAEAPSPVSPAVRAAPQVGERTGTASAQAAWTPQERPVRERRPVSWTTVLLFLGAFLVIAASAIFAIAVWDIAGAVFKLGFLGALTVAFYAAGYYARTKLQLKAGGSALTVVGSAMLLLDCWIAIDGFHLSGPLPWGVALLGCSFVYWLSEVLLRDRFYGVIGAAAQIGWWWLLGAGLGLEAPVRIAGIAVVALVWQLTAERVGTDSGASSLARMLEWAAPLVEVVAAVAIAVDLAVVGSPDGVALASAAVVAAAGAVVVWRTRHLPDGRAEIAALLQLPLMLSAVLVPSAPWWLVAVLAVMTAAYALVSLRGAGVSFAALALASEFLMVGVAGTLLHASTGSGAVVYAVLAVTWVGAARLAERMEALAADAYPGARGLSAAAWLGGFALLLWSSLLAAHTGGLLLYDAPPASQDVIAIALVLVAWATASLIRRDGAIAVATSVWSYYVLFAVIAWLVPAAALAWRVLPIVVLAGVWLAASGAVERFYHVDAERFAWLCRLVALAAIPVGVTFGVSSTAGSGVGSWSTFALTGVGAVLFALDAFLLESVASGGLAGALATFALALGAETVAMATAVRGPIDVVEKRRLDFLVLGASGGAVVLSACGAVVRRVRRQQVNWLVVAAAVTGTVGLISANGSRWGAALAFLLAAVAWAVGAAVTEWWVLTGAATAVAIGSLAIGLTAAGAGPWAAVAAFSLFAAACTAASWIPALGPHGRFRVVGASIAVPSVASLLIVTLASGLVDLAGFDGVGWTRFGGNGRAVLFAVAGALVLVQSVRRHLEPGLYAGNALLLVAAFFELAALDVTTPEMYTTLIALYLVAMGYLYARQEPDRRIPVVLDIVAVAVLLWTPTTSSLSAPGGPDLFVHTAWAVGLSLCAIGAGIALRVRSYLYAGAGVLALVAAWRTMAYLADFWWVLLGLIGIAMLVIALTWERQRQMLTETQRRLADRMESWR